MTTNNTIILNALSEDSINSTNSYIAVPDGDDARAGTATWWSMSGVVDSETFANAWTEAGLDEDLLPRPTTPLHALNEAMKKLTCKGRILRPLKSRGYALVAEHTTDTDVDHYQEVTAIVDKEGSLVISPWDHADAETIRTRYHQCLTQWSVYDFSANLVWKVSKAADAVAMRKMGGIYFVPPASTKFWKTIVDVITNHTGHTVYTMPVMRSDDAVKAVLDAVLNEASATADKVSDEINSGDLGKRALRGRTKTCDDMLGKLETYEELLGGALKGITDRISNLRGDAVAALLLMD